ncbi:helix-turn-helix transcriptional regulator [Clostridium sp. BL-8]|uniref:helix-turn-helix transcriptional regulator n=1 Tax=Clostridium sp. BL-8 TaxID=349938 RepID=UPI00098CDE0A|nr:helix-turn-helix transcriptional regulator [Clostridium sp. BL-8]
MRSNLISARGEKSQQNVAQDIGISQKTLSALERGYRNPSIDLMKKIQNYYQISMITLFEDIFACQYYNMLYK